MGCDGVRKLVGVIVALAVSLSLTSAATPVRYTEAEVADLEIAAGRLDLDRSTFVRDAGAVHHFLLGIGGHLSDPQGACGQLPVLPPSGAGVIVEAPAAATASLSVVAEHYCSSIEAAARASTALLAFLVSLTPESDTAPPTTTSLAVIVLGTTEEAEPTANASAYLDWLHRLQEPDGAIPLHEDAVRIEPYVSAWAAWGLASTGLPHDNDAAWAWLDWFRAHQRSDGAVPEYERVDGVWVDTGTYDSLDGTTGLFLATLLQAHRNDPARARLDDFEGAVARSIAALESIQQPDGLVWAKPDWQFKLLMGQAEALLGFEAGIELATELGRSDLANRATTGADRLRAGVETLWNPATQAYDWALHANGVAETTDWGALYPDAVAQMWAAGFGLVPAPRARDLAHRFLVEQPIWADPSAPAVITDAPGGVAPAGHWPTVALDGRLTDAERAAAFVSMHDDATARGLAWPFHTGHAGQMVLLAGVINGEWEWPVALG